MENGLLHLAEYILLSYSPFRLNRAIIFHELLAKHCHGAQGLLPYMCYIGMCCCEGYDFQAVYSSIGCINQSVSFFTTLTSWFRILSRILSAVRNRDSDDNPWYYWFNMIYCLAYVCRSDQPNNQGDMSLEHRVINTLEELEVICKNKNSVRIIYTNVFLHLRSRDWKLRVFLKPELNITSPFFQKKNKATLNLELTFATITEVSGWLSNMK